MKDIQERLIFSVTITTFFPVVLDALYNKKIGDISGGFDTLLWGGVIAVLIICYIILELIKDAKNIPWIMRWVNYLLLFHIAAFVPVLLTFSQPLDRMLSLASAVLFGDSLWIIAIAPFLILVILTINLFCIAWKEILPRLINSLMQSPDVSNLRARHVPAAHGIVLEIGAGSGTNLPFYSKDLRELIAIEPSEELWGLTGPRFKLVSFPVRVIHCSAEQIPLADNSVDTVVSTWSICSIPQPEAALREMHRVLKPEGAFIFIEHGLSMKPSVARLQHWLTPLWKHFAGGCHLDRQMDKLIEQAGFTIESIEMEHKKVLRTAGNLYIGKARR